MPRAKPAVRDAHQKPVQGMLRSYAVPLALLVVIPAAPILRYVVHAGDPWVFAAGAMAIGVLADWVRRATEELAARVGPAIGGLLNVSFGSLAELTLALSVLTVGNVDVVRAQITGSILGTSLLGLGLAVVVGSIGRTHQVFNREKAGQLASLLILVVIAMLLPAVFDFAQRGTTQRAQLSISDEHLSLGVSIIMLALYGANLVYTLITHRSVFASNDPHGDRRAGTWPTWASFSVLIAATAAIALEAHLVSQALDATSQALGLSSVFIGVVVLALVGTASDLFAASWFARQGKMGLVLNICVGSAIQVALVVAPLLVLGSWFLGRPMTLVFRNPLALFGIVSAAFIVNAIATDGETTWFEGVLLIGVYILLALAFFFSAPVA